MTMPTTTVIDSERGPLRAVHLAAAREFGDANGEIAKVVVHVTRAAAGGSVVVSSPRAMPTGQQYRFRQHIEPLDAWRACREWLDSLPIDYCVAAECADLRAEAWRRLVRDYLTHVPCVPTREDLH